MSTPLVFSDLPALAQHLREELELKRFALIYAYNGTGKTRLSGEFKNIGKKCNEDGEVTSRDTLYFNAFTEDLFSWDNDLENDERRVLRVNRDSQFLVGLTEFEMDVKIGAVLARYTDLNFYIDYENWEVTFFRERTEAGDPIPIKVSRGEENTFVWCFYLAVLQLAVDGDEAYAWVKYAYIDDPISSLDESNAVSVAHHLAAVLRSSPDRLRAVVSTHHVLFFNVMSNELSRSARKYFLAKQYTGGLMVEDTESTPFLYHLASLTELWQACQTGALYTYHFNVLRRVMEQTATFLGLERWDACIKPENDDPNGTLYKRIIDLMSHGDYSLFEPRPMVPENKEHFRRVLRQFVSSHPFRATLFPEEAATTT